MIIFLTKEVYFTGIKKEFEYDEEKLFFYNSYYIGNNEGEYYDVCRCPWYVLGKSQDEANEENNRIIEALSKVIGSSNSLQGYLFSNVKVKGLFFNGSLVAFSDLNGQRFLDKNLKPIKSIREYRMQLLNDEWKRLLSKTQDLN